MVNGVCSEVAIGVGRRNPTPPRSPRLPFTLTPGSEDPHPPPIASFIQVGRPGPSQLRPALPASIVCKKISNLLLLKFSFNALFPGIVLLTTPSVVTSLDPIACASILPSDFFFWLHSYVLLISH